MHETHRLVDAASTLSTLLKTKGIPHAFYGNIVTAVLSKSAFSDVVIFSLSFGLPFIFFYDGPGNILRRRNGPKSSPPFSQSKRCRFWK